MDRTLREDADAIIASSLKAVLPDEAVRRALAQFRPGRGRVLLVAAGKAAWQMTHAAVEALGRVDGGVVVTKYGHVKGEIPGVICCEAREAGCFLGTIARTHAGQGKKLAFLAGGETVVHLTGKGLGGRSQELALAAAPAIAGQKAAVFSVGSDGTDGPTDAAGGYVDGDTAAALAARGLRVFDVLQNNDAYHALQAVGGLIVTGATGTNVNDVAVALVEGE